MTLDFLIPHSLFKVTFSSLCLQEKGPHKPSQDQWNYQITQGLTRNINHGWHEQLSSWQWRPNKDRANQLPQIRVRSQGPCGKPGVLQFMRLQRGRHNLATEQQECVRQLWWSPWFLQLWPWEWREMRTELFSSFWFSNPVTAPLSTPRVKCPPFPFD